MNPELGMGVAWVIWAVSWWLAAFWANRTEARSGGQVFYRVLTLAGLVLLFQAGLPDRRMIPLWDLDYAWRWAMVGLAVIGFAFCWWARLHLGRLWSAQVTRKTDHRVVDSGPYGLVRHPIYTGIIVANVATAIQRGTLVSLAGAALLLASWIVKARLEERFLRAELGAAAYDAYAARVPMLIPFTRF